MNTPSQGYGGRSNWGLFITVPICLVLIVYFLASGLRSADRQVAAEILKPAWYTPKTARGEKLENKSMVGSCFLCHAYWVGIPKLKFDWSKIVERDGTQIATVGTHWPMSRALNKEELDTLLRTGTCMGCHQNMTDKELWQKVSEKGTLDTRQHLEMMNKMIKFMAEKSQKGKDW